MEKRKEEKIKTKIITKNICCLTWNMHGQTPSNKESDKKEEPKETQEGEDNKKGGKKDKKNKKKENKKDDAQTKSDLMSNFQNFDLISLSREKLNEKIPHKIDSGAIKNCKEAIELRSLLDELEIKKEKAMEILCLVKLMKEEI